MKTLVLILALCCTFSISHAEILTVSNNINSPGQYTNIQTAVDSANVGDTLLVSGSVVSYGNVTINKALTLFGAGYDPGNTFAGTTILGIVYLVRFDAIQDASGTKISGFNVSRIDFGGNPGFTLSDVVVERCMMIGSNGINIGWPYTTKAVDCVIQNNIFTSSGTNLYFGNINTPKPENLQVRGNIFNGNIVSDINSGVSFLNLDSVYFRNNIFTNSGTGTILDEIKNAIFENNIFFRKDAGNNSSDNANAHCNGCAFNNNITYQTANDVIPYGNNVGSGNMIATDPMLVNYPITGAPFSFAHDYTLQGGSPALLAGTDASDIGITGGAAPFEVGAPPRIPQMTSIQIGPPTAVPLNGTLQIQFTARKQN